MNGEVVQPLPALQAAQADEHLGDLFHADEEVEGDDREVEEIDSDERQGNADRPDAEHLGEHAEAGVPSGAENPDDDGDVECSSRQR